MMYMNGMGTKQVCNCVGQLCQLSQLIGSDDIDV